MSWLTKNVKKANELNETAREAVGNGGRLNGPGMGVTGAQRRAAEERLAQMVAEGTVTRKQAERAKEDALRQAGAKGGAISRRFGR